VTVTASSPALQGPRTAVTDAQGIYSFTALPPGEYEIQFQLAGFATVTQRAAVPLGLEVERNVVLSPAGVTEAVQVTSDLPAPIETPIVGQNFRQEEIEALATPRTIQGIAQLAPAVSEPE
jgi:hypothetical protein